MASSPASWLSGTSSDAHARAEPKQINLISREHHIAIARVVVLIGRLEWLLHAAVNTILRLTGKGDHKALTGLRNDRLIKHAHKASLVVLPSKVSQIDHTFACIDVIRDERHHMVHSIWLQQEGKSEAFSMKHNPVSGESEERSYSIEQLNEVGDDAEVLCSDVIEWSNEIHAVLSEAKKEAAPAS